jgi:histidine ammonia-lyase
MIAVVDGSCGSLRVLRPIVAQFATSDKAETRIKAIVLTAELVRGVQSNLAEQIASARLHPSNWTSAHTMRPGLEGGDEFTQR